MDEILKIHTLFMLDFITDQQLLSLRIQITVCSILLYLVFLSQTGHPQKLPHNLVLNILVIVELLEAHKAALQEQNRLQLLESVQAIESLLLTRYWTSHKQKPRLLPARDVFQWIFTCQTSQFYRLARMSKSKFMHLADVIRGDYVFLQKGNKPQAPVEWQLLVTLANLGLSGTAGGSAYLSDVFGISVGSVYNYTYRCLRALISREKQFVSWPTQQQRAELHARQPNSNLFKDCVGFMDGTIIPLAMGPRKNKEDYWMRKMVYGLNSMIVCDHEHRILYSLHGWCGSAHDSRVMRASHLMNHYQQYFAPDEYLLADSGYPTHAAVVPAFKKPRCGFLDRTRKSFNFLLSSKRVAVEHTIGILKKRWTTMSDLPLVINNDRSAARATIWLRVCCMLHNYLLDDTCAHFTEVAIDRLGSGPNGFRQEEADQSPRVGMREVIFEEFAKNPDFYLR